MRMGSDGMDVLVTGASGFIGSCIATEVLRAGHVLTQIDLRSGVDCRDFFRHDSTHFDAVVHCAAVVGGRRVMDWTPIQHAANLAIDAALFEWAERTRPGRVVYFSSSCAYPEELGYRGGQLHENEIAWPPGADMMPDQLYGWTKLTGELLAATAQDAGVPVSVVRPFSVYGPGMNEGFAVRGFLEQVQRRADPVVIWGDAGQVRDYIHVDDVAGAVLAILEQGAGGPVNLGTGRATSLRTLAALMAEFAGYSPEIHVDANMPAGVPSLVADVTRLHGIYKPQTVLEDYLAGVLG
jgi:nucleoside-diphosphate-sugar epimerase